MSVRTPDQHRLAERLQSVRVSTREDLEISRHVFRGEPCYIIRDPITFQSHRFSPEDYRVFVSIDTSRTLGEIYAALAETSGLSDQDEERFYQFVFSLHRCGFLNLPISDDKLLYRRHLAKRQAKTKQRLMGFLFLQIPLVNPDAFLTRTLPLVRWMFSRTFFAFWFMLVGSAFYVAAVNWEDLVQPIHGLLATRNLVVMWFILIALKIFHELGHAYACKHFGGHVPEMGAYLIAFTPCAYVDATASWGFARKRDRLIVSLAGVYFELIVAAVAVFVWASTSESLANAIAYNVMFLASAVTLLFNINPLMRYDGYFVASDLLEIPNLRARSTQYVLSLAKRWLLGVGELKMPAQRRLKWILLSFGTCATSYRVLVLVGIATMVALKFSTVGLVLAAVFLSSTAVGIVRKLANYLWFAQETSPVRTRAVALSAVLFVVLPVLAGLVPVPGHVHAAGVVTAKNELVVRATSAGFVEEVEFERGSQARPGDLLVCLTNSGLEERIAQARAELDACRIRQEAYEANDPAAAQQDEDRRLVHEETLAHYLRQQRELRVASPEAGYIVDGIQAKDIGRHVEPGEALVCLVSGRWEVRTVISDEQYATALPKTGDGVSFRSAGTANITIPGTIANVSPVGTRHVDLSALTADAGGNVVVEPATGQATRPYFELNIVLDRASEVPLRQGLTGVVQIPANPEPLLARAYRGVARFVNRIRQD